MREKKHFLRIVFVILLLLVAIIVPSAGCFLHSGGLRNSTDKDDGKEMPPSLYISRIFPESLKVDDHYPGDEIKISFYLKNTGGLPAENIKIGLAADKFFEMTGGKDHWELRTLEAGESRTFEAELRIVRDIREDSRAVIELTASSDSLETISRSSGIEILGVREYQHNFIPIIGLHAIEDEIEIPIELSTTNFDVLCRTLKEFGYQTITFSDLLKHIDHGRALPEKAVIITSDDGYQDNYTDAFPILKEYGYTMTVFLVTGVIGDSEEQRMANTVFNKRTNVTRPMLIWPEIEEMHEYGCEFLSHSVNHIRLGLAADEEMLYELITSKADIEDHLDMPVLFFAWPYDNYSEDKWPLIEEAGYRGAVRYWGGIEDLRSMNLFNIKRFEFNSYIPPAGYAGYLELFDIDISINIKDTEIPAGSEFGIEYIIKNNENSPISISSMELSIPDNIELTGVIEDGYVKEFPALSEGVFMWVSDSYLVEPEGPINIKLKFKANGPGEAPVRFRVTAYNSYIEAGELKLMITDK